MRGSLLVVRSCQSQHWTLLRSSRKRGSANARYSMAALFYVRLLHFGRIDPGQEGGSASAYFTVQPGAEFVVLNLDMSSYPDRLARTFPWRHLGGVWGRRAELINGRPAYTCAYLWASSSQPTVHMGQRRAYAEHSSLFGTHLLSSVLGQQSTRVTRWMVPWARHLACHRWHTSHEYHD